MNQFFPNILEDPEETCFSHELVHSVHIFEGSMNGCPSFEKPCTDQPNNVVVFLFYRKPFISAEARELKAVVMRAPMPSFRVLYNKHTLGLEDLSTLDHQNWLNDQVMNMYGDLIMESAQHRVHFFNSFFHRQLMTKGYEGVRRWTRKVDLFSKSLLLVPIHLEIHWCLVTADTTTKRIHLYDSQGFDFKEAAENVLRYIMTEALEKKQPSFQSGWKIYLNESIPQQTNENDCGVFVLEYCRCLALGKPLHFSQGDIPRFRKRIYKELCECKLQD
uniref:Ubiquitin-like protease family profile domain-containing protein n=1 Tax=Esox lucius TaxID=8010 RepID=A0AAY5KY15_ESOLU